MHDCTVSIVISRPDGPKISCPPTGFEYFRILETRDGSPRIVGAAATNGRRSRVKVFGRQESVMIPPARR